MKEKSDVSNKVRYSVRILSVGDQETQNPCRWTWAILNKRENKIKEIEDRIFGCIRPVSDISIYYNGRIPYTDFYGKFFCLSSNWSWLTIKDSERIFKADIKRDSHGLWEYKIDTGIEAYHYLAKLARR